MLTKWVSSAGGRLPLRISHPEFRWQVVKVQQAQPLCRQSASFARQKLSASKETKILAFGAVFREITSDCTTVALDIETDVEDISIFDQVIFPFQAQLAACSGFCQAAERDQILIGYDFGTHETAL